MLASKVRTVLLRGANPLKFAPAIQYPKPTMQMRTKMTGTIPIESTTLLSIRKGKKVCVIGDGQLIQAGTSVILDQDKKVRRIGAKSEVISGFIGATPESTSLLERMEEYVDKYPGDLEKACIEFALLWRKDKYLRRCEAHMILADKEKSLLVTGMGSGVYEAENGITAIGGAGSLAYTEARNLFDLPDLDAEDVAKQAMAKAAEKTEFVDSNFIHDSMEISEGEFS